VIALPTHLAQVRYLPVFETLAIGLGPIEQSGDSGSGEQSMVLCLERGELVAANVGTTSRHHDRGVPTEQGERTTERVESAEFLLELFVSRG
jgi:hypothetical protein